MSPTDDLVPMLKKLRLSGVLQSLELRTHIPGCSLTIRPIGFA